MFAKGKNRRGWKQKLFGLVPSVQAQARHKRIWLHAVSVGEVHVLNALVEQLEQEYGEFQLFISTTTETGFDRAVSLFASNHCVFFFPFDFSWAIKNAIGRIKPDMLVLAELELWPNLIHLASEHSLPVMVANGRLSENSHANYRRFGWLTRSMFEKLSLVAAQDETYAQRFVDLGCAPDQVTVTGNLKYDAVQTNRDNPLACRCRQIAESIGISDSDQIFVAGSTQVEDEVAAIEAWISLREQNPLLKLVLVPRHPDRAGESVSILKEHGVTAKRRSQLGQNSAGSEKQRNQTSAFSSDALVVDVIGELSGWWALADVAFVGGSMGSRGGQNMIEPAAYGIPVCFGPNTANFKSTVDGLLRNEAAKVVADSSELAAFVDSMLRSTSRRNAIGERAQGYVNRHCGAVEKTINLIQGFLGSSKRKYSDRAA